MLRPSRFAPGKHPVSIAQEAGGASELLWTHTEYLAPTRVHTRGHPAHSDSLHWLQYPSCLLIHSSLYLYQPSVNVTKYQKGVYYTGVKVFNMLPVYIKTEFDNPKKFKGVLQKCLCENSFYSLDEYFEIQKS